nr:hypothetical protein [Deinococcus malanensis]
MNDVCGVSASPDVGVSHHPQVRVGEQLAAGMAGQVVETGDILRTYPSRDEDQIGSDEGAVVQPRAKGSQFLNPHLGLYLDVPGAEGPFGLVRQVVESGPQAGEQRRGG